MATTSLWRIHGWLGKVVVYVENPDKTENPRFYAEVGITEQQTQGLTDVIDYAVKTSKTAPPVEGESAVIVRQFVDGINVCPLTARDSMLRTQRAFQKTDGVVAYHGYQSFAPGEATPEMAHEIGMQLARQLWGARYQVLVATHLDQANHLHNHFIINTVSHIDGKKFHRTKKDYYDMQKASDALCRENDLSVIEAPQRGKFKHYGEWKAAQEGRQTWRSLVKTDIDHAITHAMTERQFWDILRQQGYEVKVGKDISVRPPGKERFVRLARNFGDGYTIEGIRRRILERERPPRRVVPPDKPARRQIKLRGKLNAIQKSTGLRALYFYYCYRMGISPKKREANPKRVYFLFREDIRFIQNIARETRLLVAHRIDTTEQLIIHKGELEAQFKSLCLSRKHLRNQCRRLENPEALAAARAEIAALSQDISKLRREVRLCEDIEKRSAIMHDKLRSVDDKKTKERELIKHELFR